MDTAEITRILSQGGILAESIPLLIQAAKLENVPLYIAAAFTEKESGGVNTYGHDSGGAMFGVKPVTEANYLEFLALLAAGARSNGVGPLQITWPGFFPLAAQKGLKLWVPFDNFCYGLSLVRSYLKDESDASIIAAGTRYNGKASYGASILPIARKWQRLLTPTPIVPTPPVVTPIPPVTPTPGEPPMRTTQNTNIEALVRSRSWRVYKPKGRCAQAVVDALTDGHMGFGQITNAADAWRLATQKEYSRNPPAGAPMYFWTAWDPHHIAISTGNPSKICRSTDMPINELMGECTIPQMEARWGRGNCKYLGWSRDVAGVPIPGLEKLKPNPNPVPEVTKPKPPVKPTPPAPPVPSEEEELMALTVRHPVTGKQIPVSDALWSIWTYVLAVRDVAVTSRNLGYTNAASLAGLTTALQASAEGKDVDLVAVQEAARKGAAEAIAAAEANTPVVPPA